MPEGGGNGEEFRRADVLTMLDMMNDRMADLQKSYLVLNECHRTLDKEVAVLNARIETVSGIIKFFISPGMALLIIVKIIEISKQGGIM